MRNYNEAETYSKQNPSELVEFKRIYPTVATYWTGTLLNGEREGVFEYCYKSVLIYRDVYKATTQHVEHKLFRPDGRVRKHCFSRGGKMHGECVRVNEAGLVVRHQFYNSSMLVEELNAIVDDKRDEAFYFTLSLYGIDKEYTFQ